MKKANKSENKSVRRISGVYEDKNGLLDHEGNINDNSNMSPTKIETIEDLSNRGSIQLHKDS